MREQTPLALAVGSIIIITAAAFAAGRQYAYAQTQAEMTTMAVKDWQKSDKELNKVYQQLLNKTERNYTPATKQKLIASERAWIAYREADANFEASVAGEGGTIYYTVLQFVRQDRTEARTKYLKNMLAHEQ